MINFRMSSVSLCLVIPTSCSVVSLEGLIIVDSWSLSRVTLCKTGVLGTLSVWFLGVSGLWLRVGGGRSFRVVGRLPSVGGVNRGLFAADPS